MPGNNDDLLAGFQVGDKIIPKTGTFAAEDAVSKNQDLFAGFQVGAKKIPLREMEESRRETIEGLPGMAQGVLAGEDQLKAAGLSPILLTTTDPQEFGDILANAYPGIIGVQHTPEGEILAVNNKTGAMAQINKPGFSGMDALQTLGLISAFTPAGMVRTAAPAVAGTALRGAATRMGAAGATEAAIQGAQAATGGEFDAGEVALAPVLAGVGEAIPPLARGATQAIKARGAAKDVGVSTKEFVSDVDPAVKEAQEAASGLKASTGKSIDLFQAQQTLVPSELIKQRFLPQVDAGSRHAAKQLGRQNEQAFDMTMSVIGKYLDKGLSVGAERRVRSAAQQFEKILTARRSEAFDASFFPALEDAAARNIKVPISKVDGVMASVRAGHRAGSPTAKLMDDMRASLKEADREILSGSNLHSLHNFKKEIAQKIHAFEKKTGPLDEELKVGFARIYDSLAKSLRGASKQYDDAMEAYIAKTPDIEDFQSSLAGQIAKRQDNELLGISTAIADRRIDRADLINAKKVIDATDPEAWRAIAAKALNIRLSGIEALAKEQGADFISNMPGQLMSTIYGNPTQRRVFYETLPDTATKQNFLWLETTLKRASAGRAAGSPTAPFTEVMKNLRGRLGVLKDAFTKPLESIQEVGDASIFDRRVKALTIAAFDSAWAPRMMEIRKMSPASEGAQRALTQLLQDVEATELAEEVENNEVQ